MSVIHQISVFLENRAGSLSEITRILADSGINLRALSIAETSDYGVLRIIADDTEKATEILLEKGCILSKTPVFVVAVPDEPAGLSKVLELLAEKNVDIEYMYSLFTHQNGKAFMVFRLADEEGFRGVIEDHGLALATPEEVGLK
ncbi:MAG: ACT domain-containing protein [Ruminococcaceae bacterium]|nr:ACT domain-containing protein [Oscillospiraceae bacterium]